LYREIRPPAARRRRRYDAGRGTSEMKADVRIEKLLFTRSSLPQHEVCVKDIVYKYSLQVFKIIRERSIDHRCGYGSFRCPKAAWQFLTMIHFPAVKVGLVLGLQDIIRKLLVESLSRYTDEGQNIFVRVGKKGQDHLFIATMTCHDFSTYVFSAFSSILMHGEMILKKCDPPPTYIGMEVSGRSKFSQVHHGCRICSLSIAGNVGRYSQVALFSLLNKPRGRSSAYRCFIDAPLRLMFIQRSTSV
jgi:hypothetical protein